ncbi:CASP-like protein 4A2 isoform X2 [Diospyros lotus]|uniref:CASP-like protein 4A2 isoform X2 n=1 Tax=Diospyros lotus TaxID=55363 RepID=UPI00225AF6F0|nr:CASP-like protein 4A2 isoform X2 [Diospyros lotus]
MDNRESSRSKRSSNRSMSSDTDSQMDTFHSPLRSESPLRSDDPDPPPDKSPAKSPSKAIVAFDKYYSPLRSPNYGHKAVNAPLPPPPPVMVFNRAVKEDVPSGVTKLGPAGGGGEDGDLEDGDGGVGGERRSRAAVAAILRRTRREMMLQRAELGFRVCEMLLCLISFSVMAADKTQGWSGDSFDRYKEYSNRNEEEMAQSIMTAEHRLSGSFYSGFIHFLHDMVLCCCECYWICIFRVPSMRSSLQFDHWEKFHHAPPPLPL